MLSCCWVPPQCTACLQHTACRHQVQPQQTLLMQQRRTPTNFDNRAALLALLSAFLGLAPASTVIRGHSTAAGGGLGDTPVPTYRQTR